jgi:hypothetical protein
MPSVLLANLYAMAVAAPAAAQGWIDPHSPHTRVGRSHGRARPAAGP